MKKPIPIGDIVGGLLEGLKKAKGQSGDVGGALVKILDKRARLHIKPVAIKGKELVVNVDSSAWLYTLNSRKPRLLGDLKEAIGSNEIIDIRFRIGEVDGKKSKNSKGKRKK